MSSVFISYSDHEQDQAVAQVLTHELKKRGLSVFVDRAITAGEDFSRQIREALVDADVVVVLLSSNSQKSRWIKDEVAAALESRQKVIPVLLDAGAKENWMWPLLVDRQAKTISSEADVRQLARDIENSIAGEPALSMVPPRPLAARGTPRLLIAVAIVAALLGAFLTILFTS
jgi:hypothetical protein